MLRLPRGSHLLPFSSASSASTWHSAKVPGLLTEQREGRQLARSNTCSMPRRSFYSPASKFPPALSRRVKTSISSAKLLSAFCLESSPPSAPAPRRACFHFLGCWWVPSSCNVLAAPLSAMLSPRSTVPLPFFCPEFSLTWNS